ncbi:hypothetical protein ACH5RR_039265 [Cinchona calisaya]|uniref:Uncharacterized protein n=1 Tax=Cinchona calisaya TaxID=153742 RepID=A0ABD2XXQ8_9GENT
MNLSHIRKFPATIAWLSSRIPIQSRAITVKRLVAVSWSFPLLGRTTCRLVTGGRPVVKEFFATQLDQFCLVLQNCWESVRVLRLSGCPHNMAFSYALRTTT